MIVLHVQRDGLGEGIVSPLQTMLREQKLRQIDFHRMFTDTTRSTVNSLTFFKLKVTKYQKKKHFDVLHFRTDIFV